MTKFSTQKNSNRFFSKKNNFGDFFGIGVSIRIGWEIQCLPYGVVCTELCVRQWFLTSISSGIDAVPWGQDFHLFLYNLNTVYLEFRNAKHNFFPSFLQAFISVMGAGGGGGLTIGKHQSRWSQAVLKMVKVISLGGDDSRLGDSDFYWLIYFLWCTWNRQKVKQDGIKPQTNKLALGI